MTLAERLDAERYSGPIRSRNSLRRITPLHHREIDTAGPTSRWHDREPARQLWELEQALTEKAHE